MVKRQVVGVLVSVEELVRRRSLYSPSCGACKLHQTCLSQITQQLAMQRVHPRAKKRCAANCSSSRCGRSLTFSAKCAMACTYELAVTPGKVWLRR